MRSDDELRKAFNSLNTHWHSSIHLKSASHLRILKKGRKYFIDLEINRLSDDPTSQAPNIFHRFQRIHSLYGLDFFQIGLNASMQHHEAKELLEGDSKGAFYGIQFHLIPLDGIKIFFEVSNMVPQYLLLTVCHPHTPPYFDRSAS